MSNLNENAAKSMNILMVKSAHGGQKMLWNYEHFNGKNCSWRAKNALELINIDLCGPMQTPSHNQNRYLLFLLMILKG